MPETLDSIGPYDLLGVLGRGGMGVVYRALHRETNDVVALKTVSVPQAGRLQSIRREISGLRRLRHPGIVRILDEGLWKGIPWYAMELLQGLPLRLWMSARSSTGPSPTAANDGVQQMRWWSESLCVPPTEEFAADSAVLPAAMPAVFPAHAESAPASSALSRHGLPAVLNLMRRVCASLEFLHGQGMLHRDLKPENIVVVETSDERRALSSELEAANESRNDSRLLAARGSQHAAPSWPVLVDFGLAASFGTESGRDELDVGAATSGTVHYMAPEQIRGGVADARTDLYAVGCLLFEMLCGRAPFVGRSVVEVLSGHLTRQPARPSSVAGALDPRLDELVLRLLSKNPRDRLGYSASVAAVLEELGAEPDETRRPVSGPPRLFRPAMAGRRAEKERLLDRLRLGAASGALVLVGGESGVGKTRLLGELVREIPTSAASIFAGACREIASEPLQALRGLLQAFADQCRELGPGWTARILGSSLKTLALYEPDLAGLDEGNAVPSQGAPAAMANPTPLQLYTQLCRVLRRLTQERPVILLLDDLQWADELSLGWLTHLEAFGWLERMRLFVVGTYRSEEATEGIRQLLAREQVTRIDLGRLDLAGLEAMISDILSLQPVPSGFTQLLGRLSEGNPLFVTEYLRAVVERGLLQLDQRGRWTGPLLSGDTVRFDSDLSVPRSLRGLLTRRFERLDATARELVAAAAVLGREIERGLLFRAAGLDENAAAPALDDLLRREVFVETETGLVRFAHDKLREIAAESLDAEASSALHRAAAGALEDQRRQGDDSVLAELARHWERAGNLESAREVYLPAARRAVERGAFEEAERLYRSHLRLVVGVSEHSIEVRNELAARLYHLQGRLEDARTEHTQALAEARQIGARRAEGRSLRLLGSMGYHTGRLDEAESLYIEALFIGREVGDVRAVSSTLANLSDLLNLRGRSEEAARHSEAAVELDRLHELEDLHPLHLGSLAMVRSNQGRMDAAEALYSEALGLLRRRGDRDAEGTMLSNLGNHARMQGQLDRARTIHKEALQIQRDRGHLREEARILGNLAEVELEAGRLAEAEALGQRALTLNRRTGNRRSEAFVLDVLALVHLHRGQVDDARRTFLQSLETRRSMNSGLRVVSALLDLADLARYTEPELDEARRRLAEIKELLDEAGDQGLIRAHWLCRSGHLHLAEGRTAAPSLEALHVLEASAGFKPTEPLRRSVDVLRRAQAAFEAGDLDRLYRGEMVQDLPIGLRRTLVRSGKLSETRAALPQDAAAPVSEVELELDWD